MGTARHKIKFFLIAILLSFSFVSYASAIDYDAEIKEKQEELEEKKDELEASKNREYSYEQAGLSAYQQLVAMQKDIQDLEDDIAEFQEGLAELEAAVEEKSGEMEEQTYYFNEVSRSLYKISRVNIVELVLTSNGLTDLFTKMGVQKNGIISIVGKLKGIQDELSLVAGDYNQLSEYLVDLDEEIERLADEKAALESKRVWYQQMAAMESAKQTTISRQVKNITAEQQALINAKLAATKENTSVGEYEPLRQTLPEAPFSPAFAVVSIGYPHRVGLSQYGAYGRSKSGQTYREILSAYYNATITSNYDVPDTINVTCSGSPCGVVDFEDEYMKGIAEMPTYWGSSGGYEALKAQAVAARSYALAFTNNGTRPICADQNCQVYLPSKVTDPNADLWHQAVDDTRGVVLTSGGVPISAYYAMTAGGYTRLPTDFDVGWGSNPAYLKRVKDYGPKGAYDGPNYGNCPWYYKAWYAESDVHPWLTEKEMVDLLNASLLSEYSAATYNKYLSRPDLGGWTSSRIISELEDLDITPFSDVDSISLTNNSTGYTASLQVVNSKGVRTVSGIAFGDVFVLRSRGYLALWSRLYDIVQQ